MDAKEDDDFWNNPNAKPKPADQSETQTKKITYYSSNEEDLDNNKQEGLRKSKHLKDEKNAKEHIGEHHGTNDNKRNKPDNAGIYDKLFQNLDRLKPRKFDESKRLEDESSDDNGLNHQQNVSAKNKSDGLEENHKNDSSSNSSDSDKESEAHSSASSRGRKHISRRNSQEQDSSSDRKDRETGKESNGCQDHESVKRDYNGGNQTSEDEKHSGNENNQKSKMKLTKKSRKAKKDRSPSLSRSDPDLRSSFHRIQNQHQFNAFDKSTKDNICKWVKENNQLARKKRDEKRRADRQKKSDAEEDTKSPDRISKKTKRRKKIPAARPRSSSDPGEERSRDAGVPRRSRSQPRTRRELRSGDFDWSTSKNDEIQSWLKEKTRLLRKKRAEEKKKRRMERKMKEEKQRQRDEKFADSFERVSEWTKQKMEQERLMRKKQKEEILREKERQEQRSTRKSADYHKLRPNNNLNPSFGLCAKGQEHPTKQPELPLLKQREKQRQTVLRNSAKLLDATSSVIQLGKEDEHRQFPSQRNSEKLEEISVNNKTGICNLPSPPARIRSTAKPGEQYPVRRSISLSRIRIPKENEKGNIEQAKLKKKITFDEWLGKKKKIDDELKRQELERKKLDADTKVPQNARVDVTPSTEERVKDIGRPRPKSGRRKAKNSPGANGNDSVLVPNPYINGGMDVPGTSLWAKSPKPEVDVRPQSSAVQYQKDSWNGFSDYLWDQVNEQEGGELITIRDKVRLQVRGAETDKPKDNQQIMTVKTRGKVAKSPSLLEDKEGHDKFHELNGIKTKDLKNETEKSNEVDRITPAHLIGETPAHRAMKIEADLIKIPPTSEEEYDSKYSPLELNTGSANNNGLNSYAQKSDIHTIIDADEEEEFEPITKPKQETLDLENLNMEAKSLARHTATQHADYEGAAKTPRPNPVMRNESSTSDIEEDIASNFDVTGSKSSGSSL